MNTMPARDAPILIVDDQAANIRLLERLLRQAGYTQLHTTTRPREALDLYRAIRPGLILLDLMMPELDGFAVLDQLAALRSPDEYQPVLVLTADITPAAKQRALAKGATDFLSKPFDLTEVTLRIGTLLHIGHLHRQLREQNRLLETRVRERMAELTTANAELQHQISQRREQERARRESEERFRRMSEAASEAMVIHRDGLILDINPAYERMFGFTAEELRGQSIYDRIAPESRATVQANVARGYEQPYELTVVRKDGTTFPVEGHGKLITVDGVPARVTIMRDITERLALEARLRHQAFHDSLTGLPNRALLRERLGHALRRRREAPSLAVLFLDLDHFKVVNDSLGHAVGDQLLRAVTERLTACLRPSDTLARLGGDEFIVLLETVDDVSTAVRVAERLIAALRRPIRLGATEITTGLSVGIALAPADGADPDSVLRAADVALYRAKQAGRGRLAIFDPCMHQQAIDRLELEAALRRALDQEALQLHYQPIIALASEEIVGVEALARWTHPQRGPIGPGQFIPLAEETGLIVPLGQWVLTSAARQVEQWQQRLGRSLRLAVNLSAREFQRPELVDDIQRSLVTTRLAPATLTLELTESVLMEEAQASAVRLGELTRLGVRLVVDDFGTGFSSLSYLKRFPVDGLKIDRSFVAGLGQDAEDSAIVQAIVTLARTLRLEVTAEGIEGPAQLAELCALGCDLGQGYHVARPLPPAELTAWLDHRGHARRV